MDVTFQMLTFRILTIPLLLCHEGFLLSKAKNSVLKYEMYRFQTRKIGMLQIPKHVVF